MPDHVTTHLSIVGSIADVTKFEEDMKGKYGSVFSFNRVVPVPEILADKAMHEHALKGYKLFLAAKPQIPDECLQKGITNVEEARAYMRSLLFDYEKAANDLRKSNFLYASDFCEVMWGTRSDAYHPEVTERLKVIEGVGGIVYQFDTAWSFPERFFEQLAHQYPHLEFFGNFYEESLAFAGEFEKDSDSTCLKVMLDTGSDIEDIETADSSASEDSEEQCCDIPSPSLSVKQEMLKPIARTWF